MHTRVTLRLGNHKGSPERQLPRQPTPQTQPGLYPTHGSDCPLPIHPLLRPPPPCTPFQKVVPFPRGLGDGEVPHLSSPPRPAASQALSGKLGTGRTGAGLWGRTPSAEPETRGHPGSWPQLAHLKEHLKEAELGKKEKGGGPATRAALSSPVPSLFLL